MAVKPGTRFAPEDILDDVSGTYMTEAQTEGKDSASVNGRWTGLYRKRAQGWHLINVFTCRKEACRYFAAINDGHDYRLAPLRGMLHPVPGF